MEKRKELMKEYYDVLKTNQLKLLEISGVDIKQLQELQVVTSEKMNEVAEAFHTHFLEAAPIIAEAHKSGLIIGVYPRIYPHYDCIDPPLETALDCQKIEEVYPEEPPQIGEVECVKDENLGRLRLELHGLGSGVPVTGTVTCSMIFSRKDSSDDEIIAGDHTVYALVQANGYQLMQLWTGGCGGSAAPTTGHLKITVKMCVTQLYTEVWGPEHVLLDTTTGGPPGAIDFNKWIKTSTDLIAGSDADIKVEFKIEGTIDGHGQIYADLKTSEFFYFKVPKINVCRITWWWWGPIVAGFWQRLKALWAFGGILHMEKSS